MMEESEVYEKTVEIRPRKNHEDLRESDRGKHSDNSFDNNQT